MLKKIGIVTSVLVLLFLSLSCSKTKNDINKVTEFTINYSTEVAVPQASIGISAPADFTSPEVPTQSSSRFASEQTTADLIDEIKLTRFVLSTATGNLDYLKSVSIYMKAAGVAETLVASKSNIPAGSTTVNADLTGANIKEHIFKDKIQLRVNVTIDTGLTSDQKLKIDQTVTVKGKKI